jgi:hypothetical protein
VRSIIKKILNEETRRLLKESGIKDIKDIAKRYQMAKIYFHLDLDGVTTALAMKNYLEQHGIEVVDAEPIQYGSKEFAVKKPEGEGEIMPVLVDFAHGKPMFVIHTDHHDTQAGVEQGTATSFKPSRSNVETISQTISPTDIFSPEDIETISMIDSADFAKYDIKPEQVMQYLFKIDREKGFRENKRMMGLLANKLLLAFKNKPDFLKDIVMNAKPSLLSILMNIKDQMKSKGYAPIETLMANQEKYNEQRKTDAKFSDGVISQYGLGSMKAGSYDRYVPFKNFPDAEFLVTGLPLGMVQASCNPYKKERALKGVNLGEIKDEVLDKFKNELENQKITFGDLKRIAEIEADYGSVGFTFKDMMAIYGDRPSFKMEGDSKLEDILDEVSQTLYKKLSYKQRELLDKVYVNGYDVIRANSGGHKCITNISGINFIYRNKKETPKEYEDSNLTKIANYKGGDRFVNDIKIKLRKFGKLSDRQIDAAMRQIDKEGDTSNIELSNPNKSYVDLTKEIQQEFVRVLKDKIQNEGESNNDNESEVDFGIDMMENYVRVLKGNIKSKYS